MTTLHMEYREIYEKRDLLLQGIDPLVLKLAGEIIRPKQLYSETLNDIARERFGYPDPFAVIIALVSDLEPVGNSIRLEEGHPLLCPSAMHMRIISSKLYEILLDKVFDAIPV